MGVDQLFRIHASLDFLHQKLKLAVGFPRCGNHLVLETFGNSSETCLDLIGSLLGSFQDGDSPTYGRGDLVQQFGDYSASCAVLETGKAFDDLMGFGFERDLDARLDGWHDGSRWTLMDKVWPKVDTSSIGGH